MRVLIAILVIMLAVLQYRLWTGEGSLAEVHNLRREIAQQALVLERLQRRNSALQAEVSDLKKGLEAIEERARNELGMIRKGETFYQIIAPSEPPE
ncbi:MAG: cell division protein FtsB [Gammaproteobacteria bacterium]|nr:cell division protein FtsB [Gammaproteobacteria bacterium]